MADRLYRSRDDRMLAGVAGGLARVIDADPSIIRVVWVIVTILSGGLAIIVYVVMAVVVPEAPDGWDAAPRQPAPTAAGAASTRSRPVAGSRPTAPSSPSPEPRLHDGGSRRPAGECAGVPGTPAPAAGAWIAPRSSGGGRRAGAIIGVILILLGGAFLVREFVPAVDLSTVWPLLSIGFGILLLVLAFRPRRATD